jgi:hypothetical protein
MNNENKITDLSKAYEGQYIILANGEKYRIGSVSFFEHPHLQHSYDIVSYCDELNESYFSDGRNYNGNDALDIVELKDSNRVQAARIEGEIKGLLDSMNCKVYLDDSDILAAIYRLNEQLKALRNESN